MGQLERRQVEPRQVRLRRSDRRRCRADRPERRLYRIGCFLVGVLLGVGTLLGGLSCGDGDNPVKPTEAKDYVFYYRDQASGTLFGYHLMTARVDTFTVPYEAVFGMHVSADGRRLYLYGEEATGVVDLATNTLVTELPFTDYAPSNGIKFSPDGRYLAILGNEDLSILTYPDHELVFADTLGATSGSFSPDGERFYYTSPGLAQVRMVHTATQEVVVSPRVFSPPISQLRVLADESRWVLYQNIRCDWAAGVSVYDPVLDTLEFQEWFYLGCGMVVVSPDCRWAFYDNPGDYFDPGPGTPCEFRVLDLGRSRLDRLVSTVGIKDGINPQDMTVGWLYVSPDSRWLVAAEVWGQSFLILDMGQMKVVRYVDLGGIGSNMFAGQEGK